MAASGDPCVQSVNNSESNPMKLDSKQHQHDKSHVYLRQVCLDESRHMEQETFLKTSMFMRSHQNDWGSRAQVRRVAQEKDEVG